MNDQFWLVVAIIVYAGCAVFTLTYITLLLLEGL
jgi:hypothetical protein